MLSKWKDRLGGAEQFMDEHRFTMSEALRIDPTVAVTQILPSSTNRAISSKNFCSLSLMGFFKRLLLLDRPLRYHTFCLPPIDQTLKGPVAPGSDITSKSGFFASFEHNAELKRFLP
jgi:hypothetical protein